MLRVRPLHAMDRSKRGTHVLLMSSHDCLVWVGRSYPTIADYIKEAERRGCCRQVPAWPSWVVPGVSRVFLAHHGNSSDRGRGEIFGYYVLAGVDVIVPPGSPPPTTPRQILRRLREWPVDPPPSVPKSPVPGGLAITTDLTELEEARDCPPDGLRISPKKAPGHRPALYFVDRLERAIAERFRAWLFAELGTGRKRAKLSLLRQAAASRPANRKRQAGHPAFIEIMSAEARRVRVRVPKKLAGRASARGALVVFNEPYPCFERRPMAAFRGFIRIDGQDLLDQITSGKSPVDVPYYVERGTAPARQAIVKTARDRHLTIAAARQSFL